MPTGGRSRMPRGTRLRLVSDGSLWVRGWDSCSPGWRLGTLLLGCPACEPVFSWSQDQSGPGHAYSPLLPGQRPDTCWEVGLTPKLLPALSRTRTGTSVRRTPPYSAPKSLGSLDSAALPSPIWAADRNIYYKPQRDTADPGPPLSTAPSRLCPASLVVLQDTTQAGGALLLLGWTLSCR